MTQYALGSNELLARNPGEEQIAVAIVRSALERGYIVTVDNTDERVVRQSLNEGEILGALSTTGMDTLIFYSMDGSRHRCMVQLVYGNGADLIHDSSIGERTDAILGPAMALAEELLEQKG